MLGVKTRAGLSFIGYPGGVPSTAAGGWSPVTLTNGEGAASFVYGELAYISANNTVMKAQSDGTLAEATCVAICVNATAIAAGATGKFVFGGRVPGLAVGAAGGLAYLSATPGAIATVPNLTAGQYNVLLGVFIAANVLEFNPQLPILN